VLGADSHYLLLLLLLLLLQGEGAAGWYSDHLIVAEALVNSLAEKFSAPLQVGMGRMGITQQVKRHSNSRASQHVLLAESVKTLCLCR
jgi:hypothetical protein